MNIPSTKKSDDLMAKVLGTDPSSGRARRRTRLILAAAAVVVIILAVVLVSWLRSNGSKVEYVTTDVVRGNMTVTVQATGNLAPTKEVTVGSEVSGQIMTVYVDDNDKVTKGQLLAQIDLSKLNDEVAKSMASLSSAEAQLAQTQATVAETKASLARMKEVQALSGGKVPAKTEIDAAEANLQRAQANEASAKGTVANAQAELRYNQTNIKKATIISPVDGVVLERKIEPGQTVQASFSAPELFTIAENLALMKLEVDVDEADVGDVREGQTATFTVDTYPNRKYHAVVQRVRLGSTTTSGIVSYKAVLTFNNDDLSLRPGMTGNAEIITLNRENAILAPSAAFRWSPPEAAAAPAAKENGGLVNSLMPRPPDRDRQKVAGAVTSTDKEQTLWVLKDGKPVSVRVTVGASNGRLTEITSGNLEAGAKVITETAIAVK
ncbi:MAG: efflux RND transporter periplasmic adaptor subunit [Acidobacteriota bacterium]|nr:efflux RND transporter periplasmic adaptor subunit [Acidobacteriota bacterium]